MLDSTWTPINIPSSGYQVVSVDSIHNLLHKVVDFINLILHSLSRLNLHHSVHLLIGGNVILNWTTATELNNLGFDVEKSFDDQDV